MDVPSRFFLVRFFPQKYPPTTAIEAAAARRTMRAKKGLDPRALAVWVVVSVSVVVTRTRVWVVVVVVEAISATPAPWIASNARAHKQRSSLLPPIVPNPCLFIMDPER